MREFLKKHGEGMIYGMAIIGWMQIISDFVKWLQ